MVANLREMLVAVLGFFFHLHSHLNEIFYGFVPFSFFFKYFFSFLTLKIMGNFKLSWIFEMKNEI